MGHTLDMEAVVKAVLFVLTAIGSYLMYQHRRIDRRLDRLEDEYHRLDRSQAEISVEIREIKTDIGYIRIGLDKIIEKL